jgi:crotonobetainyl-CoA:carnitine CoA-transferase CaiB-like acyl-CoA transferase
MIRVEPELHEYPPAPTRGQHTAALLDELGYDRETIEELQRTGAFGDTTNWGTP